MDDTFEQHNPAILGSKCYKTSVPSSDITTGKNTCAIEVPDFGCSPEFTKLAIKIMVEENFTMSQNTEEALSLYENLVKLINAV